MQQDIAMLQQRLVDAIKEFIQDETILHAFKRVPRHEFVPSFFDRVPGRKREWRRVSALNEPEEWLEKVYTNRPLTISIDAQGYSNCSSSLPDLMALMIQSVSIGQVQKQSGRVLEVGTGTGYNAALIGSIIGPTSVTTVDINQALLDVAGERIRRTVGTGTNIMHLDGRHLPHDLREFDAIIVTGAHQRLETSWIEALKPGGRIVFNWMKSFARVMIEAEKCSNGTMIGKVSSYGGDFMGLHDGQGITREPIPFNQLAPIDGALLSSLFDDQDFRFFSRFICHCGIAFIIVPPTRARSLLYATKPASSTCSPTPLFGAMPP